MSQYLKVPVLMNFELTDKCPLQCSQCYCKLNTGKELDKNIALEIIKQAAQLNIKHVNFSGGETLLYPHLYELISYASENGIFPNIAISGWSFSQLVLERLLACNVHCIFVSLNGSTNVINSYSRNGYDLALNALMLLKNNNFPNTYINWVMQSSNADDFPNMLKLCEDYNVKSLVIMGLKPDSNGRIDNFPSKEQIEKISVQICKYTGKVEILIDSCFSQLKAYMGRSIFTNTNQGLYKGCTAGLDSFTLNVDGNFSPCRHLFISEVYSNIKDYWINSPTLKQLRDISDCTPENCSMCKLHKNCRPCKAIDSTSHIVQRPKNNYCTLYQI